MAKSALTPLVTAAFISTAFLAAAAPAAKADYDAGRRPFLEHSRDIPVWGGRHHARLVRVEAQGSYGSDYLPYSVQEWRARRTAIDVWLTKVTTIYGARFANWRGAESKRVDCEKGRGTVFCFVSAIPSRDGGRWGWNAPRADR